jgi:hypothetical protein
MRCRMRSLTLAEGVPPGPTWEDSTRVIDSGARRSLDPRAEDLVRASLPPYVARCLNDRP